MVPREGRRRGRRRHRDARRGAVRRSGEQKVIGLGEHCEGGCSLRIARRHVQDVPFHGTNERSRQFVRRQCIGVNRGQIGEDAAERERNRAEITTSARVRHPGRWRGFGRAAVRIHHVRQRISRWRSGIVDKIGPIFKRGRQKS